MEEFLKFEEEASRSELFVRIIYSFIIAIVLGVYGIVAGICESLQWILILITGKRNESLNNVIKTYVSYSILVAKYMCLLSDERPPLGPQNIKVYVE